MTTIAVASHEIDVRLTIAETDRDMWANAYAEAIRQRDAANANVRYLSNQLAHIQSRLTALPVEAAEVARKELAP